MRQRSSIKLDFGHPEEEFSGLQIFLSAHGFKHRILDAGWKRWQRADKHRVYDDEVVVLGKLTAQGVSKSQFGKSRITRSRKDNSIISVGDDLKAATTDCLKKCATLFGIGLHLYFDAPQTSNGKVQDYGNAAGHWQRTAAFRKSGTNGRRHGPPDGETTVSDLRPKAKG